MPNWISLHKTLENLDIIESEIVEYLNQGLQPYSDYDFLPIPCPDFCHEYHIKFAQSINIESAIRALNELLAFEKHIKKGDQSVKVRINNVVAYDTIDSICDVFKKHNGIDDFDLSVEDIKKLKIVKNEKKEELKKIQERIHEIVNKDPEANSWKFFIKPVNAAEIKRLQGLIGCVNSNNM